MKTIWGIAYQEFRLQCRRPALWIALVVVTALMMWETFPNAENFQRLSALGNSAYAAARLFDLGIPPLAIVAVILTADRLRIDRSVAAVLWTTPRMTVSRYVLGKTVGSLAAVSLLPLGLGLVGMTARWLAYPEGFTLISYLKAWLLLGVAPLLSLTLVAMMAGTLVNVRLCNIVLSLYVLWSSGFQSAAANGVTQIYRFIGNMRSLIYVPTGWPYQEALAQAGWRTLCFECGVALIALGLLSFAIGMRRERGAV